MRAAEDQRSQTAVTRAPSGCQAAKYPYTVRHSGYLQGRYGHVRQTMTWRRCTGPPRGDSGPSTRAHQVVQGCRLSRNLTLGGLRANQLYKYASWPSAENARFCREQGLSAVLGAEPHRMRVSFGRTTRKSFPSGPARTVQDSAPAWPMRPRRAPSVRRRPVS